MDVLFLKSTFRLYPGLKMSIEHNSIRRDLFLSACFCWDSRLTLREMDQKEVWWNHWLWELVLGVLISSSQNIYTITKYYLMLVQQPLTTTIKRGNQQTCSYRWLCFCPNSLSFCWSSVVAFGEFTFQKLVKNQLFGSEFGAVRQDTIHPHQDSEPVNF